MAGKRVDAMRRIADQPHAAVHVTWQLIEFMQRPKGGCRNAFEQHPCSVSPMVEGTEHFFLAGIAYPRRIAWPGWIRAAAIGNEGHYVDKAALFDRECKDMCIKPQVHLRDVDQVFIHTFGPPGVAHRNHAQGVAGEIAPVGDGPPPSRGNISFCSQGIRP